MHNRETHVTLWSLRIYIANNLLTNRSAHLIYKTLIRLCIAAVVVYVFCQNYKNDTRMHVLMVLQARVHAFIIRL